MTFSEKLVFLMNLTAVSNKQLADAVRVDPSLVSRLRTGRRAAPRKAAYIRTAAQFFAERCRDEYQRVALSEAMRRKQLKLRMDTEQLSAILYDWLTDTRDVTGQFLNSFERFPSVDAEPSEFSSAVDSESVFKAGGAHNFVYYGNEGKRAAVDAFLAHLATLEPRGTILLSADENAGWFYDEPAFFTRIREKLIALLQRGFRLCRIAAPLNSSEQAFDSLSMWLPIYMTGQVEAYYYPRMRDELYHRTLLLLPDVAAVVSTSVGSPVESGVTLLTGEKRVVHSFGEEFSGFRALCRPMLHIYSGRETDDSVYACMSQFESDKGARISQSTTLSSITTPPALLEKIACEASDAQDAADIRSFARAQELFRFGLADDEAVDIHRLASLEELRAGEVPVAVSYLGSGPVAYYTPETYALHLESILEYMERYPNYRAVLLPRSAEAHALLVKENGQALLVRPGPPLAVFSISQPNISEACRVYLGRLAESTFARTRQRKNTMALLRSRLAELKER